MSPKVTRIIFVTKSLVFMRFPSISINLLEFFRIMSFVFDLKYLSQNTINLNMLGVFWNPQDKQFLKHFLDLHFEQYLKEILRVYTAEGQVGHHCIYIYIECSPKNLAFLQFLKLCSIFLQTLNNKVSHRHDG